MNSKLKKMILAGISVSAATLLVACGGESGEAGSDNDGGGTETSEDLGSKGAMESYEAGDTFAATEPLNFSIAYSDHPNYPINDDWLFWSKLTETTNVTLDPVVIPMSDYAQKRSLLISAGDAPLIIEKTYPGEEQAFVSSGAILAVSDYTYLMPHYTQKVEEWGLDAELDGLRQEDGKYYVLPGLHETVKHDYSLGLRTDIFDDLNIEYPNSWDELEEALAKIKEETGMVPFSDRWQGQALLNFAAASFGTIGGWGFGQGVQFDKEADAYVYAPTTDEYKTMVEYFAGLVEQGLMDPESWTQDDEQAVQVFTTGKSAVISANSQTVIQMRETMNETLGADNFTVQKIVNPEGPAGALVGGLRTESGRMISAKALERDDFEALMQFVDWLWYSDEGQLFAKWGVEGETFVYDDEGKIIPAEGVDYLGLNPNPTGDEKHLQIDFGFSGGVFAYGGKTELVQSIMDEEEVAFQNATNESREVTEPGPPWPIPEAAREQLTLLGTPLKDSADTATLQFITGQRSMDEYDAFISELEGQGLQQYLDVVNEAYNSYKENN
ncbi:ABC transporter substrate-binding protein [Jeotgalibaca ciconiae]|uniref:Extracellular solute-binding protein n=1 Tax=Jeotgalibaca ciconiae TaxID=2496265 RepID=A0A3S9H8E0_9LACT|nr:extracellular solute-binding protein [Jeotgalibaca ciconiae]AZP03541.1 extracellular solute-binding protein [Jeotgalibaca ciconiae]